LIRNGLSLYTCCHVLPYCRGVLCSLTCG
jgi:hypothetical protein